MNNWVIVFVAGLMSGSFAVPMKTAKKWNFHHIWGLFSFLGMIVLPSAGVIAFIPQWSAVLGGLPGSGLLSLVVLGLIWGVAAMLYGVAVEMLGVALGVSILLGLSIVVGSIVPRFIAGTIFTTPYRDTLFVGGLLLAIGGIVLCGLAGRTERDARSAAQFKKGLIVAIVGGIGSPVLNIGFQQGVRLLQAHPEATAMTPRATWVAWAFFLFFAAVSQVSYCEYRVLKESKQSTYFAPGAGGDLLRVVVMAAVWFGSTFLYAVASAALGPIGPSLGWPVFVALIVLASNVWGVILGEWKGRPSKAFRTMVLGSVLLAIATLLIAQSG